MPVDTISEYACVEECVPVEQSCGILTYHVTFSEGLNQLYGQLLLAIEADGYRLVHVDIDGDRHAGFVEHDDYETYRDNAFTEDVSHWVDDRGERREMEW